MFFSKKKIENVTYFSNEKEDSTIPDDLKDLYVEDKNGKKIIDITRLHDFVCRDKSHSPLAHQLNQNVLNHTEDEEDENPNLFDMTNYLKADDHALFEDHLIGTVNQMEVFQKLVTVEKKRQTKLMKLEGFLSSQRDFANIYDLIDQIKENVFQRENYDHFLLILQYLTMIPSNDEGDELWDSLSELLERLIYKKENIPADFFSGKKKEIRSADALQKEISELQNILKKKDLEIEEVLTTI